VELFRIYQHIVRPENNDPLGLGAIVSALHFFEWVLLAMRESDFKKATLQSNISDSNPEIVTPSLSSHTDHFI
jgi:hypothetical protein